MAANKFATMLHKNTHMLIVILVYAILEWILILLLLLNSFFSYLIGKFASYFGLKPPCSWCSNINQYLEPNNDKISSYKDLVCEEQHANEISRLWYCQNHRKLSESERLCRDCSPFQSERFQENTDSVDRSFDEGLMIWNMKNNHAFDRLIPVELTDSSTISRERSSVNRGEDESKRHEEKDRKFESEKWIESKVDLVRENSENEKALAEADLKIENSLIQMAEPELQDLAVTAQIPCTNNIEAETMDQPEAKEIGEEKIPVGPTKIDYLHQLNTKGSCNGNDTEGDNGIEMLKAELEAERKALSALYTELEEERNAAAIATNQTMAMITRLQEEKAAMQMEALQYQRMMDEQSDYDQEALQLLNELMMKKEKEKQKLEKELEIYRKEEQRRGYSSVSWSNAEEEEENGDIVIEQDCEEEREETDEAWIDCIKHLGSLEESVKEFEEEKLTILDELKELEEKLFTLVGNEEHDVNSTEQSSDGVSNGCDNGDGKSPSLKRNWLLPLFDAAADEEEAVSPPTDTFDLSDNCEIGKRVGIEEGIDHVYERLQMLEADREFVKQCVSSIKNGNKEILQEVLQHLRDLKDVESQVRNGEDSPLRIWESAGGDGDGEFSDQVEVQ